MLREEYAALATSRRNLLRGALVAGTTTVIGDAVMGTAPPPPGARPAASWSCSRCAAPPTA